MESLKTTNNKQENNIAFTSEFWDNFIKTNWEKEEIVDRESLISLPISEDDLFEILVEMSDSQRESFKKDGKLCNETSIFIDDGSFDKHTSEYFHLFPSKEDKNFTEYSQRVDKELDGKPFVFVVDAMNLSQKLKAWTHDFLKGMYRPLKAISFGNFWSVFYGNYTSTPGGVHDHKDVFTRESAFYFPLVGNKKMRTWTSEFADKNEDLKDAADYSDFEKDSILLSANPGDVMYWPSDRWHVGSSAGGDISIVLAVRALTDGYEIFSVMTRYGMFNDFMCKPKMGFFDRLRMTKFQIFYSISLLTSEEKKKQQITSLPFDPDDLQGCAEEMPQEVLDIGKPFEFLFKENLQKALSAFWLIHLSTLGVFSTEERLPPIEPDSTLRLKRNVGTILLWRCVDSETVMMVSGYHFHVVPSDYLPVIKFICNTEQEQEITFEQMKTLVQEQSSDFCIDKFKKLVSYLVESRSFTQYLND